MSVQPVIAPQLEFTRPSLSSGLCLRFWLFLGFLPGGAVIRWGRWQADEHPPTTISIQDLVEREPQRLDNNFISSHRFLLSQSPLSHS